MNSINFQTMTDEELHSVVGGNAWGDFWSGVGDGMSEGADFVMGLL